MNPISPLKLRTPQGSRKLGSTRCGQKTSLAVRGRNLKRTPEEVFSNCTLKKLISGIKVGEEDGELSTPQKKLRDCYVGVPRFESQTTLPQTTN